MTETKLKDELDAEMLRLKASLAADALRAAARAEVEAAVWHHWLPYAMLCIGLIVGGLLGYAL
jgi:hypothetical protein